MTVTRVTFHYGSMEDVIALDGNGEDRHGFFQDQLVATVYSVSDVTGEQYNQGVLVECLNGIFTPLDEIQNELALVGSHTPQEEFVIGAREGLVHHVDYEVAIEVAEYFGLELYRGKAQIPANRITPEEARQLEPRTDWVQVTVGVKEGDYFNLREMIYIPASVRT